MQRLAIVAILSLISAACTIWAEPQGNVVQQMQSAYVPTLMDSSGIKVAQPGTILVVQIDGVMAAQRKGLSGAYYNAFVSGQIGADGGLKATALNYRAINPRALAVGEKVYLLKTDVGANAITFSVQSCGACDPKVFDPTHEPYRAEVAFKFVKGALAGTDFNQVKQVIEQVFKFAEDPGAATDGVSANQMPEAQQPADPAPQPEQAKYPDIQPPPPPSSAALRKGMTIEEVTTALGAPESIIDLGGKVIYKYDSYKVTFVAGKVSEYEQKAGAPVGSTQPVETAGWDPKYGRMSSDDVVRISDAMVRYDLNYLRLNPAALDQKPVMQYFIALNNCNDASAERAIFNELDYPAMAAYYKPKALQILASVPRTVTGVALYRYIGGQRAGNMRMWTQSLSLGEYNRQRQAFPLKYPGKENVEISGSLSLESTARNLKGCPSAVKAGANAARYLPVQYAITLQPVTFGELPMDEDAARKYIDSAGPQRNVFLGVDVTILDNQPDISRTNSTLSQVTFGARAARIRVIDATTVKPLGTLFDDHSVPTEVPVPPAPPPPPARQTDTFAAGDRLYNIRMSVYVSLAVEACGWPLTDEQSANLKRFLDQVSNRGNFNERYQYNVAHTRIKNSINTQGRMNYCANPSERRDFDKYAAMVSPLGPLAAPPGK